MRTYGTQKGEGGYELFTAVNLYVGTVEVCVQEGEWGVIERSHPLRKPRPHYMPHLLVREYIGGEVRVHMSGIGV